MGATGPPPCLPSNRILRQGPIALTRVTLCSRSRGLQSRPADTYSSPGRQPFIADRQRLFQMERRLLLRMVYSMTLSRQRHMNLLVARQRARSVEYRQSRFTRPQDSRLRLPIGVLQCPLWRQYAGNPRGGHAQAGCWMPSHRTAGKGDVASDEASYETGTDAPH